MQNLLKTANSGRIVLMVFLIGHLISGCTYTSERLHPQFPSYRYSMGVMLVLVPEIGIFEQMPDGSRLFQDVQSQEAQRTAQQSIARQLQKRHFTVQTADAHMMQLPDIHDVTSIFRSVNRSIQLHTYGPQIYPAKLSTFDYTIGPVAEILKANKADGLVLVIGHQSSFNRHLKNWLSIAVVEPEGGIVWYCMQGDPQHSDLQAPEGVTALVARTMANFWDLGS